MINIEDLPYSRDGGFLCSGSDVLVWIQMNHPPEGPVTFFIRAYTRKIDQSKIMDEAVTLKWDDLGLIEARCVLIDLTNKYKGFRQRLDEIARFEEVVRGRS